MPVVQIFVLFCCLGFTRFFMEDCVRCHGFSIGMNFFSLDILHAAEAFADEEGIAQYLSIVKCVGQGSNIFMPGGYYFFDIKQKKGIFVF